MKVNSAIKIDTKSVDDFCTKYIHFLRPLHRLPDKEIEVLAHLVKYWLILEKQLHKERLINDALYGKEITKKIVEECNIKVSNYRVIISSLRRKGIIDNRTIDKMYIPKVANLKKGECYKHLILLNWDYDI